MSGIAGIVGLDSQPMLRDEICARCAVLIHRGSNDEGFYLGPSVAGHAPVELIDFETGQRSGMKSAPSGWMQREDDNVRGLRWDPEAQGHRVCIATDPEAIVHLWPGAPGSPPIQALTLGIRVGETAPSC